MSQVTNQNKPRHQPVNLQKLRIENHLLWPVYVHTEIVGVCFSTHEAFFKCVSPPLWHCVDRLSIEKQHSIPAAQCD